ncbi:hypothetical protein NDU88_000055 [Pleurodeles waltl]|uniref:Uncharacterized protein n=1 Tax=Pleurodeles waltl TaxID=8319 RepID=A0AAV7VVE1_PLEWA|nr:hypothetical protein NDU88_000055 [Pleurodeles waltl]
MWLHDKGLVDPVEEGDEQKEWLSQRPRRKKRTGTGTGTRPTKAQAACEQAQALKEANMFSTMQTSIRNEA